jgi:DNA-binding CsgD family transcriptional regulator
MHTSPALVTLEVPQDSTLSRVDEIIRSLLEAIGRESRTTSKDGVHANCTEQVLLDAQVDGARYLLIRMAGPSPCRIQLSPREQEIVRMVAKGHPNKVIADVLNISSWTVCTHLRRIFAKLGVGSRAAMVAQLLEIGALASDRDTRETRQAVRREAAPCKETA